MILQSFKAVLFCSQIMAGEWVEYLQAYRPGAHHWAPDIDPCIRRCQLKHYFVSVTISTTYLVFELLIQKR